MCILPRHYVIISSAWCIWHIAERLSCSRITSIPGQIRCVYCFPGHSSDSNVFSAGFRTFSLFPFTYMAWGTVRLPVAVSFIHYDHSSAEPPYLAILKSISGGVCEKNGSISACLSPSKAQWPGIDCSWMATLSGKNDSRISYDDFTFAAAANTAMTWALEPTKLHTIHIQWRRGLKKSWRQKLQFSDRHLKISDTGDTGAQNFNFPLNSPK